VQDEIRPGELDRGEEELVEKKSKNCLIRFEAPSLFYHFFS